MSAATLRHGNGYVAGQRLSPRGRWVAGIAVVAAHLLALVALLLKPVADAPPPEPVTMQVQMLAEAPVIAVPPPPPPPKPVQPPPPARMLSAPATAASPLTAPPPDPAPPAEPVAETVAEAPPAPPAPAPAPAAEPVVVPPNFVAAYLNNPPPAYPYAAKLRRESGEVRLRVLVTVDGTAGDVQIERSSGSASLDQAARDVVFRKWRFVPAKRGDQRVEAWVIVPLVFELKG